MGSVKVNNSTIEFKPPTQQRVNLTVSTTAVSFSESNLPASGGNYVSLQVQDADVRVTYHGSDTPTSADGELVKAGSRATVRRETVLQMKFIRADTTDAKVFAQQYPV